MKRDRCRSCDTEVVFIPSAKTGKPMILDAETRKGVVVQVVPHVGPVASVVDVWTDHHVTCPDADAWKGRKR